ncbi:MAG: alkaline phosphatase D family protein [Gammaproteobacteria bacterium]|nr:alkaline phosphatase D family protein [Gammaproteobacteria bacterium]
MPRGQRHAPGVCSSSRSCWRRSATNPDQWDGYPQARRRILEHLGRAGIDNVVFLTRDIHSSWALDVAPDPLIARRRAIGARRAGGGVRDLASPPEPLAPTWRARPRRPTPAWSRR